MTNPLSILRRFTKSDIIAAPYPHLDAKGCIDDGLYRSLACTFPHGETVAHAIGTTMAALGSNRGFGLSGQAILDGKAALEPWRSFFEHHLSKAFYLEVLTLFRESILATYPDLEARVGKPLEEFSVAPRTLVREADLHVDCQLWFNTPPPPLPPLTRSPGRGPHVDKETRLYSALLYFRSEDDQSKGGDLNIYSWKGERRLTKRCHVPDLGLIERVKTVDYSQNRLIFFVNSPDALHGVTPRSSTPHTRRFINFTAEVNSNLFEVA